MTGQEAVERIHQEAWIGREPGLSRITKLLSMVGDPHKALKFVHITGTNGKGSTAAMTASILAAAGLRVGLYTSPHLWRFHERFQVSGQPIPDEALGRIGERVILAGRQMDDPATEFELMTALGMLYFQEAKCDLVVLEVGLGGRLDSTNVIPAPEVAVITNIGLEHVEQLGDTHAKIAGEKAGIIKPGCDTVLYHQRRDVEEVVTDACRHAGSPMTVTDPDSLKVLSTGRDGQDFLYRGEGPYHINLLGHYQLSNALTALDIAAVLRRRGWPICQEAVLEGMKKAVWPARMELARRDPDVILDGGHNPQCMGAIRQALEELVLEASAHLEGPVLLDSGCGEGYYTAGMFRALERAGHRPRAAGIDISKYALRRAAKRLPEGEFAVASAYRLPLTDASADLLTNVFSPLSAEEFARVLRPGGTFLYVVPSARHLWEMKQVLYSQPYENPVKETPYTGFSYQRIVPVRYEITLDCPEDIRALFQMTPYCWKTPREGVEALSALKRLTTQVGFDLHVFRRSPA